MRREIGGVYPIHLTHIDYHGAIRPEYFFTGANADLRNLVLPCEENGIEEVGEEITVRRRDRGEASCEYYSLREISELEGEGSPHEGEGVPFADYDEIIVPFVPLFDEVGKF